MDVLVVVLAGGVGKRLWPISTPWRPKYFLKIGGVSLIELAFCRGILLGNAANVFISTSQGNDSVLRKEIPMLLESNIIVEPQVMNTAPAICLANEILYHRFGPRPIVFMPSDSVINGDNGFVATLSLATTFVSGGRGMAVVGVTPGGPSSQYGYIEIDRAMGRHRKMFPVARFVEKPDQMIAKKYLLSGKYLWNTGMVISTTSFVREAFRLHTMDIYKNVLKYIHGDVQAYGLAKNISFDHAILEKLENLSVIIGDFDWGDIGSFETLMKYRCEYKTSNLA
ncbi:MAG: hypothetical protein LBH49_02680 [Puniceicoccales bacterium]|jgi:mannose-1-phosphate guanylyltransferase|nr:hypothetical protein [Puniceicoccales bacterium]